MNSFGLFFNGTATPNQRDLRGQIVWLFIIALFSDFSTPHGSNLKYYSIVDDFSNNWEEKERRQREEIGDL